MRIYFRTGIKQPSRGVSMGGHGGIPPSFFFFTGGIKCPFRKRQKREKKRETREKEIKKRKKRRKRRHTSL